MRLLTILLRFGTTAYPNAEAQLTGLLDGHLRGVDRDLLIVDNAEPAGVLEGDQRRQVIGGDNRFREFSGFDHAVRYLGPRIRRYDLLHFVTDAFNTLYVDYLARFDTPLLQAMAGRPACVGHIDCYNEPIEIHGVVSQHWIRTCYFFLAPNEVRALGSFVGVHGPARYFSGDPAAPFRPDAPLSRRYQQYLIDWITGQNIGQGVEWHSSFSVDGTSLTRFEQKALTIMNEHLLGIRLRAMGCRLTDVTWLSAALRSAPASAIDWQTDWRTQLANRDQAAMIV